MTRDSKYVSFSVAALLAVRLTLPFTSDPGHANSSHPHPSLGLGWFVL